VNRVLAERGPDLRPSHLALFDLISTLKNLPQLARGERESRALART
jgi:hypothetical protein